MADGARWTSCSALRCIFNTSFKGEHGIAISRHRHRLR